MGYGQFDPSTGGWGMSAPPNPYANAGQTKSGYQTPTLGSIGTGTDDLWGTGKKQPQMGWQQGDASGGNMALPGIDAPKTPPSFAPMPPMNNGVDQSTANGSGSNMMPGLGGDAGAPVMPPPAPPTDASGGTPSIGMPPIAPGSGNPGAPITSDPFPPGMKPGMPPPSFGGGLSTGEPWNQSMPLPGIDQPRLGWQQGADQAGANGQQSNPVSPGGMPGGMGSWRGRPGIWGDSTQPFAGFGRPRVMS